MNKRVNFWEFEDLQMVCYPMTIVAGKSMYNFPDKSILSCQNACLVGFAIRDYDASRVSINGTGLVSAAFIKKSFLKFNTDTGTTFYQDLPMEWAIGKFDGGRENFMLRFPLHGIDMTNSGFRLADSTELAANAGKDLETFWFFVDGDNYPRQKVL